MTKEYVREIQAKDVTRGMKVTVYPHNTYMPAIVNSVSHNSPTVSITLEEGVKLFMTEGVLVRVYELA